MSTRKELGLCSSCGNKRRAGKTLCQDCADRRRNLVLNKRKLGICIKIACKNRAVAGESRCLPCKRARNAYNARRRQQRRQGGTAGKPA